MSDQPAMTKREAIERRLAQIEQAQGELSKSLAALCAVETAARAFVEKYALVEPAMASVFGLQQIHGMRYTGPNFGDELQQLRSTLAALQAPVEAEE